MSHVSRRGAFCALCLTAAVSTSRADWPSDPGPSGLVVYPSSVPRRSVITDGAGGAFVGIAKYSGSNSVQAVILQRVDALGGLPWGPGGKQIGDIGLLVSEMYIPKLAEDGAGGVFVAFQDLSDPSGLQLLGQRFDSNGIAAWPGLGTRMGTDVSALKVVDDGTGGCIAMWLVPPTFPRPIRAQRIVSTGMAAWGASGTDLSIQTAFAADFVSDGLGGLIAVWSQAGPQDNEIYAQRYGPDGAALWAAGGVPVCAVPGDQGSGTPGIVAIPDGAGGACVAWIDRRSDSAGDLYAQRIDASGAVQWAAAGVALCSVAGAQHHPVAISDGASGIIVAWQDERAGAQAIDLFAQRVDAEGWVRWAQGGVPVSVAPGDQVQQSAAADGYGGLLAAWTDYRDSGSGADIYAQRLDAMGVANGAANGRLVGSESYNLSWPSVVPDGTGGMTVLWSSGFSVRARNVPAGDLQVAVDARETGFAFHGCIPNPSRGSAAISFSLAEAGALRIEMFDLTGRRVWSREEASLDAGLHVIRYEELPTGLYLLRLRQDQRTAQAKVVVLE